MTCAACQGLWNFLFADHTSILFSHKDPNVLWETFNSEMIKLTQWRQANKLSANFKGKHLIYPLNLTATVSVSRKMSKSICIIHKYSFCLPKTLLCSLY